MLQALQHKYESVQAALLMETLIHKHGEAAWNKMADKEKQQQLRALTQEVELLRREGG